MTGRETTHITSATVEPGTTLNGIFAIDQKLAAGGMGEVYRGHNIATGDPVAIKVVLRELAKDETILGLFFKEAKILNSLHHAAIVRYSVFSVDPLIERPYLVMEFVDGLSLADVIDGKPMGLEDTKHLISRLASGLDTAHRAGVIHRDISPDNVILADGKVSGAKIIDFGIARANNVGSGTLLGGKFAGKYNFVSPEQLGLFGGDVTDVSDIYSLGLLTVNALRGKPIDMNGTQFEVIEKRRSIPDLSDIDVELRPVLELMLQPNPADRALTMADIAEWLAPVKDRSRFTRRPTIPPQDPLSQPSSAGEQAHLETSAEIASSQAQTPASNGSPGAEQPEPPKSKHQTTPPQERTVLAMPRALIPAALDLPIFIDPPTQQAVEDPTYNSQNQATVVTSSSRDPAIAASRQPVKPDYPPSGLETNDDDPLSRIVIRTRDEDPAFNAPLQASRQHAEMAPPNKSKIGAFAIATTVALGFGAGAVFMSGVFSQSLEVKKSASSAFPILTPKPEVGATSLATVTASPPPGEQNPTASALSKQSLNASPAVSSFLSLSEKPMEQVNNKADVATNEPAVPVLTPATATATSNASSPKPGTDTGTVPSRTASPPVRQASLGDTGSDDAAMAPVAPTVTPATSMASTIPPLPKPTPAGTLATSSQSDPEKREAERDSGISLLPNVPNGPNAPAPVPAPPVKSITANLPRQETNAEPTTSTSLTNSPKSENQVPSEKSASTDGVPPPPILIPTKSVASIVTPMRQAGDAAPSTQSLSIPAAQSPPVAARNNDSAAVLANPILTPAASIAPIRAPLQNPLSNTAKGSSAPPSDPSNQSDKLKENQEIAMVFPRPPASAPVASMGEFGEKLDWLQEFNGGDCFYARPLTAAAGEMDIEGMSQSTSGFQELETEFKKKFGFDPNIQVRPILESQCGVANFLRAFSGTKLPTLRLTLSTDRVKSGQALSGSIDGLFKPDIVLYLIDDDGFVYQIDQFLKRDRDQGRFTVKLVELKGHQPLAQLVLALSSDRPIKGSLLTAPAKNQVLFPKLLQSIRSENLGVDVGFAFFLLGGD